MSFNRVAVNRTEPRFWCKPARGPRFGLGRGPGFGSRPGSGFRLGAGRVGLGARFLARARFGSVRVWKNRGKPRVGLRFLTGFGGPRDPGQLESGFGAAEKLESGLAAPEKLESGPGDPGKLESGFGAPEKLGSGPGEPGKLESGPGDPGKFESGAWAP